MPPKAAGTTNKPAGNTSMDKLLLWKWMTLPYSILIILMGGSALDLTVRFGVKSNLASEAMQMFMLLCTLFGYYCGVISGPLVDSMKPVKWTFMISGICSFIGFLGLVWTIKDADFDIFFQIMTCIFMFLAGLGASIAVISSIVTVAKNFDSTVSILLVAILITYMKCANEFDGDVNDLVFSEGGSDKQVITMGLLSTLVYVGGMWFVKLAEFAPADEEKVKKNDKTGVLIFIILIAVFLLLYWIFDIFLSLKLAGFIVMIFFIIANFVCAYISMKFGNSELLAKVQPVRQGQPEEIKNNFALHQMLAKPKYLFLLFAYFFVEGAGYQYGKRYPSVAMEAKAPTTIASSEYLLWISDAIGRLGGGILAYFLVNKLNTKMLLFCYAVCSFIGHMFIWLVLSMDVDGKFLIVQIIFWMAFGCGGFWVLTAQIVLEDGGIDNFGKNWGMAVFFNFLGLFFF